jgi:hypothetical protein
MGPPSGADAEVADGEESGGGDDEKQEEGAQPSQPEFNGIMAENAGFANVGREGHPASVVIHDLAGGNIGFEEALNPVVLVEPKSSCVAAHDAFAEDSTGQEAKTILLQRNKVVLADLGNRGDFFQRYAARQPLHAQVFAKASHRLPENRSKFRGVFLFHNKPDPVLSQNQYGVFLYFQRDGRAGSCPVLFKYSTSYLRTRRAAGGCE